MTLRKAVLADASQGDWFIWSVNPEDNTISCLPYDSVVDDPEAFFVHDLKHFPMSAVLNARVPQSPPFNPALLYPGDLMAALKEAEQARATLYAAKLPGN